MNYFKVFILCTLYLTSIVNAEELTSVDIHSKDDFLSFTQSMPEDKKWYNVNLFTDLDLSGVWESPVGLQQDGNCTPFSGEFHGNNHTINGLVMNSYESETFKDAGLFCSIGNAFVEHLVIGETCNFTGSTAGILSVWTSGNLTVHNVVNKGSVNGMKNTGGFIGYCSINSGVVIFEDCINEGELRPNYTNGGGFIGSFSSCQDSSLLMKRCTNAGSLSCKNVDGGRMGGIIGATNGNINTEFVLEKVVNNGLVNSGVYDTSGMIGSVIGNNHFNLTVRDSINNGDVELPPLKYGAGGFFGFFSENNNTVLVVDNCVNNGDVLSHYSYTGGFTGSIQKNINTTVTFSQCTNNGNITVDGDHTAQYTGGFSGCVDGSNNLFLLCDGCTNNGNIRNKASSLGGIIGELSTGNDLGMWVTLNNCTNNGNILGTLAQCG